MGGYLTGVQRGYKARGPGVQGYCPGLKFCRDTARNAGFSADHIRFAPNGRPRRRVIATAAFDLEQTIGVFDSVLDQEAYPA